MSRPPEELTPLSLPVSKNTQIYAFIGRDLSGREQPSGLRSVSALPAAVCAVTITARGRGQRRAFPNLFRLFNPCERENNRKFLREVPTGRGEEFTAHRQPPFNCSYCQLECIYSSVHIIIWEKANQKRLALQLLFFYSLNFRPWRNRAAETAPAGHLDQPMQAADAKL